MPFINTKTNVGITKEKKEIIKQKFGKAIEIIPGKSENWLMVSLEENCTLYFKGKSDQPMAFVEVKIYGSTNAGVYEKMTLAITNILKDELSIAPDHIYVRYDETKYWGWNGGNF